MELSHEGSQLCLLSLTHLRTNQPCSRFVLESGGCREVKMVVAAALMVSRSEFEESHSDFDRSLEK